MTFTELENLLLAQGMPCAEVVSVIMAVQWARENPQPFGEAKGTLWAEFLQEAITS